MQLAKQLGDFPGQRSFLYVPCCSVRFIGAGGVICNNPLVLCLGGAEIFLFFLSFGVEQENE